MKPMNPPAGCDYATDFEGAKKMYEHYTSVDSDMLSLRDEVSCRVPFLFSSLPKNGRVSNQTHAIPSAGD